MSLWGGVLLSAGIALSAYAKRLEQIQKRLEEDVTRHFRAKSITRRQRRLEVADHQDVQRRRLIEVQRALAATLDEYRAKFKHGPVGNWSTSEIIPMGSAWTFHPNGTGTFTQYSGLCADEISFIWCSTGDWEINIKLDTNQLGSTGVEVSSNPPIATVEDVWETIEYDFSIANVGYFETVAMYEVGLPLESGFMTSGDYLIYSQPKTEQQPNA